jgi:threonine dehydrogenase-like Zn-dependent dehydrogenase
VGEGRVEVREWPEPRIERPDEVLLRVLEVGVCGTDREIIAGTAGKAPPGDGWLRIGHEAVAEVIEAGPGAGFAPGELVVPAVRRPCGDPRCAPCRVGRQDYCVTGEYTERGIFGAHGYLAERVVAEASLLHRVPETLRDVAVLTEPLTIAEKALAQAAALQERLPPEARHAREGTGPGTRHRALVLGAGPVGILGAMVLVERGYDVVVFSRDPPGAPRARLVERLGARYASSEQRTLAAVAAELGNVDLVYEAAGAPKLAFEAMGVLGRNGVFLVTGVPGHAAPARVETGPFLRDLVLENRAVIGSVNAGPEDFDAAIRDLAAIDRRCPGPLRQVVTGRFPLDRAAEATGKGKDAVKSVVQLPR